jgi:cbb3-type cytochrome oxidase subunit 3
MHFFRPFHFGFHGGHSASAALLVLALIGLFVACAYSLFSSAGCQGEKAETKKGEPA